ncbi:class I SAM-dependent RNA methyltransferase [Rhodoplanes serenus]|uniref:class I SAM-dependent RNA methyltransferase n=1 Tax=Rhodoplanes serenus TaxID=200615 RepID=UPI000DAE8B6C|nr:class I SAM-dependent RNA methyltransferase [Rhodoplanes serenus]RAI31268.1 RNA methyltransferase [Rhodoplanes serenus]
MTERLTIDRLGRRGDGVVDLPGEPVFVPLALPGETVTVEPIPGHPDRRRLVRVESASPARIAPICPHFGVCGGCATQHLGWDLYRDWKRGLVVEALRTAGLEAAVGDLIDAHGEGRRRVVLHARRGSHDILEVGFSAQRAHDIVPIDRCPVTAPALAGAIETAWAITEAVQPLKKPLDIQITATGGGLDVDVRGSGPLSPGRTRALAAVAETRGLARLTRHGELVVQRTTPTVTIGRATVALPPGPFLQATAEGERQLARLVDRHVGEAKSVVDLFAGLGPFTLRLAERMRVRAAEIDAASVAALTRAAATTSGLKPVSAEARDLFRRPLVAAELGKVDAVVFDPPRQGAEAQARALAQSKVPVVVAVSCNSATFARDAAILVAGGYRLTDVTPVDQFRFSYHVEIVARFVR